jgi:hypothetical protein
MKSLSFVALLVLLVAFCAAQNHEFGEGKKLSYSKNVEATWTKFMVKETNLFSLFPNDFLSEFADKNKA